MSKTITSPRQLVAYAGVAALVLLADPEPTTYVAGCVLAVAGIALRVWGCGHLRKNQEVTTSGPYAHLKHPLYVGTLLIATGGIVAAGSVHYPGLLVWAAVGPAFALLFFLFYLPKKRAGEAGRLERRFGTEAVEYAAAVPDFVPTLRAFPAASDRRWSWQTYRANHELEMDILIVSLFAALLFAGSLLPW